MMIQGLRPGMEMLTSKLDITFAMIWTLIIANVARLLMLIGPGGQGDLHRRAPAGTGDLFVFMGSWLGAKSMGDLILMLPMGALCS